MALDIIGLIIVITHVITIGTILLWIGLGKPKTMDKFRAVFKQQVLGMKPPTVPLPSKSK
jgi:hypothetical protein